MATGTFYPAVGGDDGYWQSSAFNNTANNMWLGDFGVNTFNAFIRFANVTIPNNASITSAYITFTSYASNSGDTVKQRIRLNDEDDATAPTSVSSANALSLTTQLTDWDIVGMWTDGTTYDTPDFKSALQEVVDRVGWSSGNAAMVLLHDNAGAADKYRQPSAINYSSGSEKAELHVVWDPPIAGTLSEEVGISDSYVAETPYREVSEGFGTTDLFVAEDVKCTLDENVGINSTFVCTSEQFASIAEAAGMSDVGMGIFEYLAEISDQAGTADTVARLKEIPAPVGDYAGLSDNFEGTVEINVSVLETFAPWDTLKWGWLKTASDSMAIAETVEKILGIPVKEWVTFTDIETNNWDGSEAVSDSLFFLDMAKAIRVYSDLIADGMDATDAANVTTGLILTEVLTVIDTVTATGIFQHSIQDSMSLEDIVRKCFLKSVSDSFGATDISVVDFLALLKLSDSMGVTESTAPGLKINQAVSDAIEALDATSISQLLQELIQDGLNVEVVVEIDGELYECWVVNTRNFHVSVYSGYDYNSFAIFNDTVYGCKADGIYELEGSTDDGVEFHNGIILPATRFGSEYKKRFRKAFFGVSGDNLVMKMETETGSRTFTMVD